MKKYLQILLMLAFIVLVKNVWAADILHSGTCGESCAWTWDSQGNLNITGEGEMTTHPWTNIEGYKTDVVNVVIQGKIKDSSGRVTSNGITSVADDAFYFMEGVKHLEIGDSVTNIGNSSFRSMWGVQGSLEIPSSVQNIGEYAFLDMINVTGSLVIPNTITEIKNGAFWGLKGITDVVIPDSVTSIGEQAFWKTNGLTELTIPDSVENIADMAFAIKDDITGNATINNFVTNLTISANLLQKYLNAMGGFAQNANINCTSGDCNAVLMAWDMSKGTNYAQNTNITVKNSDGSATTTKDGKIVGYKGKRIYTVKEANDVAGKKNRVMIKYK